MTSYRPSKNVLNTITPPIPLARAWAAEYQPTPEKPLLNLSQGVPGSPPAQLLIDAFSAAATKNASFGYGPVVGEPDLRQALVDEMKKVYGPKADVKPEDVSISAGCNLAFVAAVMSLANSGDEIILPIPWYFNHQMTFSLLGIETVPLRTLPENGFQPSVEDCAPLITPNTRAIALVTPNNPTGAVYSPALLVSFLDLARKHNLALIIDETYRDYILPGPPHSLFESDWRPNLIHLFSFSKSYHVPGLRLGAILAAPTHQPALISILDTLQICASTMPQLALAPALPSLRPFIISEAKRLAEKHALFREHLPSGWTIGSQGGFYAYVRHPFDKSAQEVCRRLATELGVVLLPGEFFGDENGWIRVAVANVSEKEVVQCCERLKTCVEHFGWKQARV